MCSKYYREINRQFIDKEGDKSSDSNASEEKYDSSEIWWNQCVQHVIRVEEVWDIGARV